jgi:hypothetical protein
VWLSQRKLSELRVGNSYFGKKHTLEALTKMSEAKKGELNPEFIAMQCGENKKPCYDKPSKYI